MAYVTYKDIFLRLNFLTLHLKVRHLNALSFINVSAFKISSSSVLATVSLHMRTRSIRD